MKQFRAITILFLLAVLTISWGCGKKEKETPAPVQPVAVQPDWSDTAKAALVQAYQGQNWIL
jgi:hypothetical protein